MNPIEKEFRHYFKTTCDSVLVNENTEKRRIFYLRPSSLPFCGLRRFLKFAEEGIKFNADSKADKLYYTGVGSTTHLIFQKIIGRGGRIVGDWKCGGCGFERKLSTYKVCDKCSSPMQYEEVELSKGSWRGHLDNIYIAQNGEWWVIDYKTCKTEFIFKKQYGPTASYREQQNHYTVMLEDKLQRKIAGWMLVYLARENPMKYQRIVSRRITDEAKEQLRQDNALYSRLHKHIFLVEKVSEVKILYENKRCADIKEHNRLYRFEPCKYADTCFKQSSMIERIRKIMKKTKWLPLKQFMPKDIKEQLYEQNKSR
jgi:hypothetical protein